VFENRAFATAFVPKKEELIGGQRKSHYDKLDNLYFARNTDIIKVIKSREMRCMEHLVRVWNMRNAYKILVTKLQEKRPLGKTRPRGEVKVKLSLCCN
jgi:hypothetical protein